MKQKNLVFKIKKIDIELDTAELVCTKTDGKTKYNFNLFASPSNLLEKFIVMKLPYMKQ